MAKDDDTESPSPDSESPDDKSPDKENTTVVGSSKLETPVKRLKSSSNVKIDSNGSAEPSNVKVTRESNQVCLKTADGLQMITINSICNVMIGGTMINSPEQIQKSKEKSKPTVFMDKDPEAIKVTMTTLVQFDAKGGEGMKFTDPRNNDSDTSDNLVLENSSSSPSSTLYGIAGLAQATREICNKDATNKDKKKKRKSNKKSSPAKNKKKNSKDKEAKSKAKTKVPSKPPTPKQKTPNSLK